jgi:hypothetical protein
MAYRLIKLDYSRINSRMFLSLHELRHFFARRFEAVFQARTKRKVLEFASEAVKVPKYSKRARRLPWPVRR